MHMTSSAKLASSSKSPKKMADLLSHAKALLSAHAQAVIPLSRIRFERSTKILEIERVRDRALFASLLKPMRGICQFVAFHSPAGELGAGLRSFLSSINWALVPRIRTTQKVRFYTFAVKSRKQRRLLTISIDARMAALTVSDTDGRILYHVVQRGQIMTFYKPKPKIEPVFKPTLADLTPIHFVPIESEGGAYEPGI